MFEPIRRMAPTLAVLWIAACATPSTRMAPVHPDRVREEQGRQREIVLREVAAEQRRLDVLAHLLLLSAGEICGERRGPIWGFRVDGAQLYRSEWRAAAAANGLREGVQVVSVVPGSAADRAGLRPGDRLVEVHGRPLDLKPETVKQLGPALASLADALGTVEIEVERAGMRQRVSVEPETGCALGTLVVTAGGINAFADGRNIIVPWTMMRFASDDELRVIIGHEIAHNAMRHMEKRTRNATIGALFGLVGDIVAISAGDTVSTSSTLEYAAAGAEAYSRDFEREADYVGLYILARAGLPLENMPALWRRFATIDPDAIAYASSHPTTAERFVLLEETAKEIEQKRAAGEALLPELKSGEGATRPSRRPLR